MSSSKILLGFVAGAAVGALAGIGLGIKTASGKVLFETEYQNGFNSTLRTPVVNVGAINKSFGFSVGYAVNL